MKKIIKLAANFSKKLKEIVDGIKSGVQLFKDIISGRLNLKDIISELIHAIASLPQKVIFRIVLIRIRSLEPSSNFLILHTHVFCGMLKNDFCIVQVLYYP